MFAGLMSMCTNRRACNSTSAVRIDLRYIGTVACERAGVDRRISEIERYSKKGGGGRATQSRSMGREPAAHARALRTLEHEARPLVVERLQHGSRMVLPADRFACVDFFLHRLGARDLEHARRAMLLGARPYLGVALTQ
eukprot:7386875-Prymnesium_polylepis.1